MIHGDECRHHDQAKTIQKVESALWSGFHQGLIN
jgi:hypothetical protein